MEGMDQLHGMGQGMSFTAIVIALILAAFGIWMNVRILGKAGYSGWWCLVALVPLVNVVMIWVFAYADWPNLKKAS